MIYAAVSNQLYGFSDWTCDPEVRRNYLDLNRHRLLHGMAKQGTRANTLRCFLILDLLADLLPALREYYENVPADSQAAGSTT